VSPGADARQRKKAKFTTLLHHVRISLLREAFLALKRRAAPGVDGVTWQDYEANLEGNLRDLHTRVHTCSAAVHTEAGQRILDADIRSFFDGLSQDWLVRFLEQSDRRRTRHPPCAQVAQGGRLGRRRLERQCDGDSAGGSGITTARQRLPALRISLSHNRAAG
jgi:hypothetical protein